MALTALEIKDKTFGVKFRGYECERSRRISRYRCSRL